jgi:hypothetical protein
MMIRNHPKTQLQACIEANWDCHEAKLTNGIMGGIRLADCCEFVEETYGMQAWVSFCNVRARALSDQGGEEQEEVDRIMERNNINTTLQEPVTPAKRPSTDISTPRTGTPEERQGAPPHLH